MKHFLIKKTFFFNILKYFFHNPINLYIYKVFLTLKEIVVNSIACLAKYYDIIEANLVKARLESEGISCYLADDVSYATLGIAGGAVEGIRLMVDSHNYEHARKLLDEFSELSEEQNNI
jgi:hypothetical protein